MPSKATPIASRLRSRGTHGKVVADKPHRGSPLRERKGAAKAASPKTRGTTSRWRRASSWNRVTMAAVVTNRVARKTPFRLLCRLYEERLVTAAERAEARALDDWTCEVVRVNDAKRQDTIIRDRQKQALSKLQKTVQLERSRAEERIQDEEEEIREGLAEVAELQAKCRSYAAVSHGPLAKAKAKIRPGK